MQLKFTRKFVILFKKKKLLHKTKWTKTVILANGRHTVATQTKREIKDTNRNCVMIYFTPHWNNIISRIARWQHKSGTFYIPCDLSSRYRIVQTKCLTYTNQIIMRIQLCANIQNKEQEQNDAKTTTLPTITAKNISCKRQKPMEKYDLNFHRN